MERLEATHIYTLGDYYLSPGLREECHAVKDGNAVTANDCAYRLAEKLPRHGCVLIPVPSLSGANEAFARMVAYYADVPLIDGLHKLNPNLSAYRIKKQDGQILTEEVVRMTFDGYVDSASRVILIDNVIATGTTMSAAIRAIGKPCEVACIAVDYEAYNHHNNN